MSDAGRACETQRRQLPACEECPACHSGTLPVWKTTAEIARACQNADCRAIFNRKDEIEGHWDAVKHGADCFCCGCVQDRAHSQTERTTPQ